MSDDWYSMRTEEAGRRLVADIYGVISNSTWQENSVGSRRFRRQLHSYAGVETIEVHLNSEGGSIREGMAIFQTLLDHPATVEVHVEGLAFSIATVIMMAASPGRIYASEVARIGIHDPWVGIIGNAQDLRNQAEELDALKVQLVAAYRRHSSLSTDDLSEAMSKETIYSPSEAVTAGLVSEVKKIPKASDSPVQNHKPDVAFLQKLFPNLPEDLPGVGERAEALEPEVDYSVCQNCGDLFEVEEGAECFTGRCEAVEEMPSAEELAHRREVFQDSAARARFAAQRRNHYLTLENPSHGG